MTTDLDRLIEAVETGGALKMSTVIHSPVVEWSSLVMASFDGSLDAAVALLEALLPGWGWGRMNDRMFVEQGDSVFSARGPNPARALLQATLRALVDMHGGEAGRPYLWEE